MSLTVRIPYKIRAALQEAKDVARVMLHPRATLRELRSWEDSNETIQETHERQIVRLRRSMQDAEAQARRERDEAEWRAAERDRAMHDLERAQRYGDEYGERRATERLRRNI